MGDLILLPVLIQLGAMDAIKAAVVGELVLIYQSVPNRSPQIYGVVDKQDKQGEEAAEESRPADWTSSSCGVGSRVGGRGWISSEVITCSGETTRQTVKASK